VRDFWIFLYICRIKAKFISSNFYSNNFFATEIRRSRGRLSLTCWGYLEVYTAHSLTLIMNFNMNIYTERRWSSLFHDISSQVTRMAQVEKSIENLALGWRDVGIELDWGLRWRPRVTLAQYPISSQLFNLSHSGKWLFHSTGWWHLNMTSTDHQPSILPSISLPPQSTQFSLIKQRHRHPKHQQYFSIRHLYPHIIDLRQWERNKESRDPLGVL
jgi:hypothetical protein